MTLPYLLLTVLILATAVEIGVVLLTPPEDRR